VTDPPVTRLGALLARLPIAPRLGKLLLVTRRAGLLGHGLLLTTMLAQPDPYSYGGPSGEGAESDPTEADGDGEGGDGWGGGDSGGGSGDGEGGSGAAWSNAAHAASPLTPAWACEESEAVGLIGAFQRWREQGGDEAAALRCGLVPKVMREAEQLAEQLAELLATLFPADARATLPSEPPTSEQARELRQALASALPDRVARLASLCDSPAETSLLAAAAKTLKPSVLKRAYLAADQGSGQLLWLPPRSAVARMRPRPRYLVFYEVTDGKRPYFSRATAVDPGWLCDASPALTSLSPPVLELSPRYDAGTDRALCWRTPTYGCVGWILPVVPRPPPPTAPAWLAAALFGRALGEGQVFRPLRPLAADFEPRLRCLTSPSSSDRAALSLRKLMAAHGLTSRAALAAAWASEPKLLLRELGALLPEPRRAALVELWPKLLVVAERKAGRS
jgi:hypothetical protein